MIDLHPSQLKFAPQTLRCTTFPLALLRTKGEARRRMLAVAPRNAALELPEHF